MARAPQRPSLPALGLLDPEVLVLDLPSKFLIGGVPKSSADDTQCFILLLTLKLLEWI